MKLVKADYNIIETGYTLNDIYKTIELAGRNCYKSENKITETSAKSFVDKIINLGHTSVLEHGTLYLDVIINDIQDPEYFQKIYIILFNLRFLMNFHWVVLNRNLCMN